MCSLAYKRVSLIQKANNKHIHVIEAKVNELTKTVTLKMNFN